MKHIYIEIDDSLHQKLKVKCYMEGRTVTQTLRRLIEKYVAGEITL
jgi:plasmid stability protein